MANRSCDRFQNMFHDMGECLIALETLIENDPEQRHNTSLPDKERDAAKRLAYLCVSFLQTLGDACGCDRYVTLAGPTPGELIDTINDGALAAYRQNVSEG